MKRLSLHPVIFVAATACGVGGADLGVVAPVTVAFQWDQAFNDVHEGVAAVIPLDVLVYDRLSGLPLADVPVLWASERISFAPPDAVLSTTEACDVCVWSPYDAQYLELDEEADVMPLATQTDADGVARAYAIVDSLPDLDGYGTFVEADTWLRIAGEDHLIRLVPR